LKGHNVVHDLDAIDDQAFELLTEDSNPPVYRVFTARGCSSSCSFCAPSYVVKHTVRKRSPENVVKTISELKDRFKATKYVIGDLTFLDEQTHSHEVLKKIIEAKLNLPFWCQTKLDRITKENVELLSRAGCTQIAIGIESYNDSVLTSINKGISINKMVEKLLLIKSYDIQVQGYFIVGLPTEKPENIERTIKFVEYSIMKGYLDLTHISIYVPYPGLPIFSGVKLMDTNYNHYHQGVFLDMPPKPVYQTEYLNPLTILDLWMNLLDRTANAFKYKRKRKIDIKKVLISNPLFEKEVILGTEALTIAAEIEEYAKLDPKKRGVFNIVQGVRKNKISFVSKFIFEDENYVIGDAEIYTIEELTSVLDAVDGIVDYILVDADIKIPISREFLGKTYQHVEKSQIRQYSDMAIWCQSVFLLIQDELIHLEDTKVCLSPLNKFTKFLAVMLQNRGVNVVYYDTSRCKNSSNKKYIAQIGDKFSTDIFVNFSFGENIITSDLINKLPEGTVIIDATTEGMELKAYEFIHSKNIKISRPEMRPLLSSQMSLLEKFGKYIAESKGYFVLEGYNFVSGGIIGKKGDIVVDSIKHPQTILGIADGRGKIIRPNELSSMNIKKIQIAYDITKKI
ncbi:B12-binding domain-containing radical SAM protein, partial [Chloroflexota bacterium]